MQGQFQIDMANGYIERRREELATDRSRRRASPSRHGPAGGAKERFGLTLIRLGARLVPEATRIRVIRA